MRDDGRGLTNSDHMAEELENIVGDKGILGQIPAKLAKLWDGSVPARASEKALHVLVDIIELIAAQHPNRQIDGFVDTSLGR